MKRSPIARSTKPIRKKRAKPRRVSVVRDEKYKAWHVENFGCAVGNQVHVIASLGKCDPAHGPVNGMRSKGGDDGIISLCRCHHDEQHQIGWPAFEEKYGIDRSAIAAEHYARFKQEQPR